MDIKKMAMEYYPRLWSKERIEALVAAGKLNRADADEVYAFKGQSPLAGH